MLFYSDMNLMILYKEIMLYFNKQIHDYGYNRNILWSPQGLSRNLETGCPNRGFIDFCVSKVWYKIHTTNKIDPIHLQILLF